MPELENLKKKFLVNKGEYEKEKLPTLIEKALAYCKVDNESGTVTIENSKLKNADKIKLVLVARFLANKLDAKISASVNANELTVSTGVTDKDVVYARMSELIKQRVCFKKNDGYELYPYQASLVLDKLSLRYNEDQNAK